MRILFVGAGATGGYFGGRLAQAGRDVTFLVRPGRAEQLRRDGLTLLSPHGDATLQPKLVMADGIDGTYDAVIVAVKAYGLEQAVKDMAPAIGPDTMVMPLLNGMRHVDVIRERHGAALIGGVCKVATTVDAEGRIRQLAPFQELAYGELDGTPSSRTTALDATMQDAGFMARLTPTIEREMWEKWTLLATMGGMCCLMRGTIGEIEAAPGGRDFVLRLLDEVVRVISTDGVAPSPEFLGTITRQLVQKGSSMASSMYRDLVAGLPVEADQILGDLVSRAARHSLSTPLLSAAYTHLCVHAGRMART
ncbi:ketopantoate reductase family protein [Paracraurococcus lichenis]|uniref:2-dehydropantoate 2-reductase n=1 Tax=Paracraurococcus lichenis TaxID=3064888 RepID=A0ABT9EDL7_9PROT|nr:ketopantoate reductase family protein [Paracraurococcus sp. LOR1-02]MDO9714318.1 ketopantoate reductase family protein [Paracraurococcus sp. LOR1-02]